MDEDIKPQPVYAWVFGCIIVLGLPLNGVSLWIMLRRHGLKSTSAVFMVNLALSDLLLVISLPMRVYFYATGVWPLGSMACMWITIFFRNNLCSSSLFITFISVDRLLAVVYPLRSRHLRTSFNAWKAVVLIWLFVVTMSIPESMELVKKLNSNNNSICFENTSPPNSLTYLWSALLFIMLAVNVVCTSLVSWSLRHLNESSYISNKVNVLLIFSMNLVMFVVCFLPVTVGLCTMSVTTPLICLATLNCCLDPLLYYFSFDAFWKKKQIVAPPREK